MSSTALLRTTLDTLLSPLSHESADEWRDSVSRALRRWVGSDAAFFRVSDGSPTRIDPLDALVPIRDAYRAGDFHSDDPWATRQVGGRGVVMGTFEGLLGADWERQSRFVNELLRPNRIYDYVGIQVAAPGGDFVTLAAFNLGAPKGASFEAEAMERLDAILPALKVAVATWHKARPPLSDFGGMVDEVSQAALLLDREGRLVHANSALTKLLESDPDRARLRRQCEAIGRGLARTRSTDVLQLHNRAREYMLHTRGGLYLIRPSRGVELVRGDTRGGVVLTLERIGSAREMGRG